MIKKISLVESDRQLIWHPFTQEKTEEFPIYINSGKDSYLFDENGKKYIDLISSWWINLHGHGNEYIVNAIHKQAKKLEHVMFAGFTHESAIELCKKLKSILPEKGLDKFFFSDNGSTSVEIAMKMVYQFWKNSGKEKKLFLTLEGDYHGDTFGAMSASKTSNFHKQFEGFFYKFKFIPVVYVNQESNLKEIEAKESEILELLKNYLEGNFHKISAFIAEPLIQGANGMKIYRPEFLNKLVKLLRTYNILIIIDEVMTGFGRTGKNFAFNHCDFIPDIICLSKGLTGGFLPMALTIVDQKIYDAFLDDNYSKSFAHGHSYTANPLGCAAAIASLELLLLPKTQKKTLQISNIHLEGLKLIDNELVENKRSLGTIAAFFLKDCINYKNIRKVFIENGLIIRPLGRECYLIPPYCIDLNELIEVYEKINEILRSLVIKDKTVNSDYCKF